MSRTARFDLADLAEAGLSLVGRSGFGSISMRSVAEAVGSSPMALYRLVADAEELKAVIADAAAPALPPQGTRLTDEVFRRWAEEAYATLSAYPGLAAFTLVHWTELPGWLAVVDALLRLAAGSGVEGEVAVGRVNAVFAFVLSRAQLRESVAGSPRTLQLLDSCPDRFPFVRANRDQFVVAESDRHFALGLTALLAGLGAVGRSGPGRTS